MGIKGLTKLLQEKAPDSYKEHDIKAYFGRKIAIDASMALYQFLIAVRRDGPGGQLTDAEGEVTSHIIGFFYRTIRMMENGVKPVYVFDGKPPNLKSHELKKRKEHREKAEAERKKAEEEEDDEKLAEMEKRLVKVGKKHVDDAKKLLDLMGVPYVSAPGEAEATCAELTKQGLVYGCATEDMDALTFGTTKMVRHMTMSEARKLPIQEFDLKKVLIGLGLNMDEFIDLCILCGCDYIPSIRGIGPKKAYENILKHKNIEGIVKALDKNRYQVPEDFMFEAARVLFKKPDITDVDTIKIEWKDPKEDELIEYMVGSKGFSEDRVRSGLKRLKKAKGKGAQKRLDSFFKPVESTKVTGKKRKKLGKENGGPKNKKQRTTTGGKTKK